MRDEHAGGDKKRRQEKGRVDRDSTCQSFSLSTTTGSVAKVFNEQRKQSARAEKQEASRIHAAVAVLVATVKHLVNF